jgi:polysaccharide deacetylase family protein (PEP-CTERM system associated)
MLDAFCVDLEEWFHVCGVETPYQDPATWGDAPSCVERDTEVLLGLLDEVGAKGTFLAVGWLAEKHPGLIKRIGDLGHEIGCHGYYHRLVFEQTPEEFRAEISRARKLLQDVSGQDVSCFRAPGFSMTTDCFWAYPILAEEGIRVDVSIVPAARDHGGIQGFGRSPFCLETDAGEIQVFPVSVMQLAGRTLPFSGGGYMRLFPMPLLHLGFRQNHRMGLPVMTYIHPREINPDQPRLPLPPLKRFKYYVGLRGCEGKLRTLLHRYRFGTVSDVLRSHPATLRRRLETRDGLLSMS